VGTFSISCKFKSVLDQFVCVFKESMAPMLILIDIICGSPMSRIDRFFVSLLWEEHSGCMTCGLGSF